MDRKIIFHIDVNSAFLSWEAVHRIQDLKEETDLRTFPSAVGGDVSRRHGIILAKSIPAKKYKIRTGEPVTDALRKCPNLVLVPPNHELYEKYSEAFMSILKKYTDIVEKYSIDEAFMDMTGTRRLFGDPIHVAHVIKDEIYQTLGFTVNVGISCNKLLAKMASDFKKPNLVHTLFPEEIETKMWPLPVGELFFVGQASEKKLHSIGIRTIGDLACADLHVVKQLLKKHGEVIWNFANGKGDSVVERTLPENKGYGNSTTIAFDVTDAPTAKMILLSLAETVGRRIRRDHVRIESVSVTIRYHDLSDVSHQGILNAATNITKEIYDKACALFDELWDGRPIRLLGVSTGHVSKGGSYRQIDLFDSSGDLSKGDSVGKAQDRLLKYEKLEKLDQAIDQIREKFGSDAVIRASFLNQDKIKPMTGKSFGNKGKKE